MYESSDLLLYPKSPSVSVTVSSGQILTLLFILSAWSQNMYSEAPRSSSLPTGLQVCCSAAFLPKPASSRGTILGHVLGLTPSAFFLLGFWAPLAGGGVGVLRDPRWRAEGEGVSFCMGLWVPQGLYWSVAKSPLSFFNLHPLKAHRLYYLSVASWYKAIYWVGPEASRHRVGGRAHRLGATGGLRALELRAGDSALGTELRALLHFPSVTALPVVPPICSEGRCWTECAGRLGSLGSDPDRSGSRPEFPIGGTEGPRDRGRELGLISSSGACAGAGVGMGPFLGCAPASGPSGGRGCLARDRA